jgi:hypothetical protein
MWQTTKSSKADLKPPPPRNLTTQFQTLESNESAFLFTYRDGKGEDKFDEGCVACLKV